MSRRRSGGVVERRKHACGSVRGLKKWPVWKKRGTIGVLAPTGQGIAAGRQPPQVVAGKGVTDMRGPPQPPVAADRPRRDPLHAALASNAAWAIRAIVPLAMQASSILTSPAQPASPGRGTISPRIAWTALLSATPAACQRHPSPPSTRYPRRLPLCPPFAKADACPR
jgi:hypothetical protein